MANSIKYLIGGRLGDFIHCLAVCKITYEQLNLSADILLCEYGDTFSTGIKRTYSELKPLMELQSYVNSFEIYDETVDYGPIVKLCDFRNSPYLYSCSWNELLFKTFVPTLQYNKDFSWITAPKDSKYSNYIIINRSHRSAHVVLNTYKHIITSYTSAEPNLKLGFVCSDISQYDNFSLKDKFECIYCETILDLFTVINSCRIFIGNQSTPYAIASSLNVPRLVELINSVDGQHYIHDTKYYSNMGYF